ncbi:hypothetical protein J1614_009251 [Plenodomus biglobosus]|nr:hypothetical protein J1614_009251 [Plenodomus biglobosus]
MYVVHSFDAGFVRSLNQTLVDDFFDDVLAFPFDAEFIPLNQTLDDGCLRLRLMRLRLRLMRLRLRLMRLRLRLMRLRLRLMRLRLMRPMMFVDEVDDWLMHSFNSEFGP